MIEELLNQLKNGRTKEDFNAVKDVLLIIASNMYYDDKLTNDQYNDVCKQLCNLRDIMNKAK
jgi:hypothetical protein